MLKIIFGNVKNAIYNTSMYFNNVCKDEWLLDTQTKKMIKDVDNSVVKSANSIISPVLGNISPEKLSGGVKTLILIKNEPYTIFNASNCGDNCAKWLLKFGEEKDITINLHHLMNFGKKKFEIQILNGSKKIINTMQEMIMMADKYL